MLVFRAQSTKAYQRLLLKMAKYNVEMSYIQGKTNIIADALSRVCCMEPPEEDQGVTLLEVNAITNTLPACPAKLDEMWNQTSQDSQLSERCHSPRVAWVSKRMPFRRKNSGISEKTFLSKKRFYPKGTPAADPEWPAHPDATNHSPRPPWCRKVSVES